MFLDWMPSGEEFFFHRGDSKKPATTTTSTTATPAKTATVKKLGEEGEKVM